MSDKLIVIKNSKQKLHHPNFEFDVTTMTPNDESPDRADKIEKALKESDLPISFVEAENCGEEILSGIHTQEMINTIKQVSLSCKEDEYIVPYVFSPIRNPNNRSKELRRLSYHCMDTGTPIGHHTYEVSLLSASISYMGVGYMLTGKNVAYGLCRPPGHHAESNAYGGYCYFNNAAIGANRFIKEGKGKVAIFDIDYHHGNGTQDIFYDKDSVLYVSIHANPDYAYPYYSGFADETGTGKGLGYNLNIPLPLYAPETDYLDAVDKSCERIIKFNPDSLIISLGVDTYEKDPMGKFKIRTETYKNMANKILSMGYPTIVLQEGGYCYGDIGKNIVSFLSGIIS